VKKSKRFIKNFHSDYFMETDRFILTFAVVIAIIIVLTLGRPTITGYVPTQTYSQNLDLEISESQRFIVGTSTELKLSSLALSGWVNGEGLVKAYLSDGQQRWLVFTNSKKASTSMQHITGFTVTELVLRPDKKLDAYETVQRGYVAEAGNFNDACVETCILDEQLINQQTLYLEFIIEPGSSMHISEITFTTA